MENIGVNKAKKYASEADLIIFVIDASRPLDNNDYEIMDLIMNKKVLVLLNKSDIQAVVTKEDILKHLSCNVISVSAKEETGIDDLENEIKNMFFNGEIETNEEIYITNLRHKNLLREALESLKLVKGGIEAGVSEDFLTIDMMNAYELSLHGVGISIYPASISSLIRDKDVCVREVEHPDAHASYALIWNKNHTLSHVAEAFIRHIEEKVKAEN